MQIGLPTRRQLLWALAGVASVSAVVAAGATFASMLTTTPSAPTVSGQTVQLVADEAIAPATVVAGELTVQQQTWGLPYEPSSAWTQKVSAATGIPQRALASYASASLASNRADPTCHLGWATLAAIGTIESANGTHQGSTVRDDGTTTLQIQGPVFNASGERAYGPMQFIASTWQRWGSDGDGNGIVDINDLDDAAWTAARYLCAEGGDLATGAGWSRAIFGYNHSVDYVNSVLAQASAYAAAS